MIRNATAAWVFLLVSSACASLPDARCRAGENRAADDTLYFGNATSSGDVTGEQWARFLETTVTPRFPQGLTVIDAAGQWRGANGKVGREATRILHLVHPDDAQDDALVKEIIAAYKTQYRQESVLRVRVIVCASF
jgi:hypothetical protein